MFNRRFACRDVALQRLRSRNYEDNNLPFCLNVDKVYSIRWKFKMGEFKSTVQHMIVLLDFIRRVYLLVRSWSLGDVAVQRLYSETSFARYYFLAFREKQKNPRKSGFQSARIC